MPATAALSMEPATAQRRLQSPLRLAVASAKANPRRIGRAAPIFEDLAFEDLNQQVKIDLSAQIYFIKI